MDKKAESKHAQNYGCYELSAYVIIRSVKPEHACTMWTGLATLSLQSVPYTEYE